MKKDDLLTHLSFFGVLMTMAVLPAPADAGTLSQSYADSQSVSSSLSRQVCSNDSELMEFEFVSTNSIRSEAGLIVKK